MTTKALEELDRGLGSCLAGEDLSVLVEAGLGWPQEDKARATPRVAETSSRPQVSQELQAGSGVDARHKKMEKEAMARGTPDPGKEKLKSGASGFAAAWDKKRAGVSTPPGLSEELPWGDVTVNKCLVLASLVALLGSAFQLCRDAVAGEEPAPTPWISPISPPKDPAVHASKPVAWVPPSKPPASQVGPPAPQAEAGDKPEVSRSRQAAEKVQGDPGRVTGEAAEEEHVTLAEQAPKEKPRKEKPGKERPQKDKKPWKKKPRKEERPQKERPQAAREPKEALPRRWEAREGGHRPWARDSRDPEHRKRQAWASPRRSEEDQPPGKQKHRLGKGRN
ncbi:junctional sarcoplasmic reticulum protein 1 [Fukomys damarensis]|uniref:Junctional sarcoplasmic reticulum protein 1 n=1 Tax=Fukomys damarensis TaxID=885580 RepID=A0A091DEF5_FUKDA|nr:junctional sarcoplasmic reticulum protein 1 [Fukomys damarensis]KFO28873.1 Junctional sarcoplasmic reticulum protein 1 [Fukomys damarensis]